MLAEFILTFICGGIFTLGVLIIVGVKISKNKKRK